MGCQVPVLYDPAHPEIAEINEQERLWGGGVAWYLFGGVFVAIGSGGIIRVLVRRSRDKKSSFPPQFPYQT